MANKVNKVIDRNGNVLIDLTNDTVSSSKVLAGTKFHGPDGKEYTGSLQPNDMAVLKYTFIDYDGSVLYEFTDDEIDTMTELPAGPDHTDENLTFQEWNWTLDDLKTWDRTRADRPIVGASMITTDGKTYVYLDIPDNKTLSLVVFNSGTLTIDWGDGTINTNTSSPSHTYTTGGKYTVVISDVTSFFSFGGNMPTATSAKQYITKIKLGNLENLYSEMFYYCNSVRAISVPAGITSNYSDTFESMAGLKAIVIPRSITKLIIGGGSSLETISLPSTFKILDTNAFSNCYTLKNVVLPDSMTAISGNNAFSGCYSLRSITLPNCEVATYALFNYTYSLVNIDFRNAQLTGNGGNMFYYTYSLNEVVIPDGLTAIGNSAFYYSNIKKLTLPDSITSIGSQAFNNCRAGFVLDLSQQTKVITITSAIGLDTAYNKILVPSILLDQYKSASYWSSYASIMVGV